MKNGLVVDDCGNKCYYLNDKLHRKDGPAIEHADGSEEWYFDGKLHRDDGPALVSSHRGDKFYYHHGKLHRSDGPAVEYGNGDKCYYIYGHRESYNSWLSFLKQCSKEDYLKYKVLNL